MSNVLIHTGVKGMKWGVRRVAKRDAKEAARAKMFYGETAGTRRKLIKAKVGQHTKDIPGYSKAFEYYTSKQDMGRHADKARGERRRKDIKNSVAKNTRGIVHIINGRKQYAAASALAIMSLVSVGAKTGINKKVAEMASQAYSKIKTNIRAQKIKAYFRSWLG